MIRRPCPAFLAKRPILRSIVGAVLMAVCNGVLGIANAAASRLCPLALGIACPDRNETP